MTASYIKGAELALEAAIKHQVAFAILKQKSPSCGTRCVYDGTFSGRLKDGKGIAAEMLERAGIKVFGDDESEAAAAYFDMLQKQDDSYKKVKG